MVPIIAVVLGAYLFLINTYKCASGEEMYLYVLISAKFWLKCTYLAQKLDKLAKSALKSVHFT